MNPERIAQLRQMAERGTICKGHITEMLDAIEKALAQPAQEPVAGTKTWFEDGKVVTQYLTAKDIYKEPAQEPAIGDIRALKHRIHELEGEVIGYKRILDAQPALERNFCPRCGKRTWDIHTCTAPLENT